jgi:uncharacterized membrane protein YqjE
VAEIEKNAISRGLVAEFMSLVGSLGRYVSALGALAGQESREAAALGFRLLVMFMAAVFFAALGYVFLILSMAFVAAWVLGVSWLWILGAFTLLHVLLAYTCARHVRDHSRRPLFEATRREIASDVATLGKQSTP